MFDWIRLLALAKQIGDELKKLVSGEEVCFPISFKGQKFMMCIRFAPPNATRTTKKV